MLIGTIIDCGFALVLYAFVYSWCFFMYNVRKREKAGAFK
jgi:hypothetical protein